MPTEPLTATRFRISARHWDAVVLIVMAVGLVLRLLGAIGTWLNPDEALHFLIVNQPDPLGAYRVSLTNAHPPLYFILLYFWQLLGKSELWLRLLSVLAGTAALWPFYLWLSVLVNRRAGAIGAALFGFLPQVLALGTEVRAYAVMFLCMASALYFLERAFARQRPSDVVWFGLFLCLSALSHYSALWLVLALGVYCLVRLIGRVRRGEVRPGFVWAWVGTQVAVAGVYLWLYFTHISKLKDSPLAQEAMTGWLQNLYFQPGKESILLFPFRATFGAFQFLFGSPVAGAIALLFFLAGLAVVFVGQFRQVGLLLLLPFIFSCAGALARLFPYGGTRHTVFLALFASAGAAIPIAALGERRSWLSLGIAGLLLLLVNFFDRPPAQSINRPSQSRQRMAQALSELRKNVRPGDTLFTDYQGSVLLGYYLGSAKGPPFGKEHGPFLEFQFGGYRVIATRLWDFEKSRFRETAESLAARFFTGRRLVWVFDAGWGRPLVDQRQELGDNIAFFSLPVGRLDSGMVNNLFAGLVRQFRPMLKEPVKTAFWPTAYLGGQSREVARPVAERVMSYEEVYGFAQEEPARFLDLLPALAFWILNDPEPHPEFMRYMDECENYISAGLRFTLLGVEPEGLVAVYLIEAAPEE
ncbi:MAG: glycosyltransferase family 39 protein [candidate division WOR-3 bacterium]